VLLLMMVSTPAHSPLRQVVLNVERTFRRIFSFSLSFPSLHELVIPWMVRVECLWLVVPLSLSSRSLYLSLTARHLVPPPLPKGDSVVCEAGQGRRH